ncbi:unknown [Succinatimonas sp. CAG:777]|jgi:hypothetical protein|nr:unknown [Succinatimonas sp. CAG:777]DAG43367.1 MAG TPA: hypothetical protein [Bacteriophage sp.]
MIKVFGVPFESSVSLRKALGLYGSKWCEKADITELLRCAFPMFTRADHVRNMEGFKNDGIFMAKVPAQAEIYANYRDEFGITVPFDLAGRIICTPYKELDSNIKHKREVKSMESPRIEIETAAPEKNDLTELKSALLSELDNIRNAQNYVTEDGGIDEEKAKMLFKRVEAVNNIAANVTAIHQVELQSKRLQLDAVKTAIDNGYSVKLKSNLLGVEIDQRR